MHPERPFRRALTLLGGSTGGQAVALLLAPVLTRLYDPAAFGVLGLFVALTTLASSIASFGLEQAVVIESDDGEARRAYGLALLLAGSTSLLAAASAVGLDAAGLLGALDLDVVLLICPAVVVAAGGQILTARALRLDRPRVVAGSRFLRAVAVGAVQLALAPLLPRNGFVLILGGVLGQLVSLLATGVWLRATPGPILGRRHEIVSLLRRHRTLLAFSTPQTLLNNAGNALVPFILLRKFGAAMTGDFSLASRVTMLPAVTIGESLRQSLLASMGRLAATPGALASLAGRTTLMLLAGLVPFTLLGFVIAPWLFAVVFGPAWRIAGSEAAWLFAAQAAGIANIPALTVITVRRWQRAHLSYQVVTIPIRLGGLLASATWFGPVAALACYCLLSCVASLVLTAAVLGALVAEAPPHPLPDGHPA